MNPRRATLVVVLLAALTGCGSIQDRIGEAVVEKAIEAGSGGAVDVDLSADGEGTLRIETEDGALAIGGASLPDGWPTQIQLPRSLAIVSSYAATDADGYSATVIGSLDTSFEQAVKEAEGTLNSGGFTQSPEVNELQMEGLRSWGGSADDGDVQVHVQVMLMGDAAEDEALNMTVTVTPLTR